MPKRAFNLYQRKRVININLNIFVAGLISIAIAKYPVMLISDQIGHEHKLWISILAYIVDTTIDIFVYFGLHWIANHWKPLQSDTIIEPESSESKAKKFLLDAGKVQAERFALVPIFAGIAIGLTWSLQHFFHMKPDWAFVVAFIMAMCVTRIVHTIWGYQSGTFRDSPKSDHPHYVNDEITNKDGDSN